MQSEVFSLQEQQLSGGGVVAEDTPELQLLERRILEKIGVTVTITHNEREAFELTMAQSFDFILMDMQMPVMDGIDITQALREKGNQTPIIALTANVMQKRRDWFDEAGCDEFLVKPINKKEQVRILNRYLK